jgi:small-conductance mechanosensitive channel
VQYFLKYKKVALCRFFHVAEDEMGRIEILNRFIDGVTASLGTLFVLDWMSVKMGNALTGVFALGSAGTLAFTLASKDLVSQMLSGLFLMLSGKMYVGDNVVFGDGTKGKVMKLGWMETTFRGSDNTVTRVPNTALSSQKISNVSRVRQSQVQQTLRFHYRDAEKIPDIIADIKKEIVQACPRLITDIRPFRVFWTNFNDDHLEVMVDTHFHIAPIGDAYWMNRQNVLLAIKRAINNNGVELAHRGAELIMLRPPSAPPMVVHGHETPTTTRRLPPINRRAVCSRILSHTTGKLTNCNVSHRYNIFGLFWME